jgi:hypothetical protein
LIFDTDNELHKWKSEYQFKKAENGEACSRRGEDKVIQILVGKLEGKLRGKIVKNGS